MNKKITSIALCVVVLAICIGVFQYVSQNADENIAKDVFENAAISDEEISVYSDAVEDAVTQENTTPETEKTLAPKATMATTPARLENGILTIGDANAPVTIMEFSSLSCPHCAAFHKTTLGALKTDYIDTGKVKFMFYDFPLNQQALHGSLLLRCATGNDRYSFMEMLFDQQSQWAFATDYRTKLKQYAALLGLSSDKAESCMNDVENEQAILQGMKGAATTYKVQSTPSFIIMPDQKMMSGALAYGTFSTEIEKRLKK